jgi:acyl-CoA reductase-like NAD-dependent aldehyde dehydrogenase
VPATLESRSPATGERLGVVEAATADSVREAAGRALVAQPLWANVPAAARARYLRRAARAALDELDDLALLLARESGRPRTEAVLGELLPAVAGLSELADEGPRALQDRRLGRPALVRGGRRALGVQQPRGVIGVLAGPTSPWTEPLLEVAAALLAGNGVVLVPAAALAGERLRALLIRAGIPDDLLAVAHGEAAAAALPDATARVVSVATTPARGAMLVLAGAPIDQVAAAALWASFAAGGHHPAAVSRLVCVPSVAEPLIGVLRTRAEAVIVGDPTRELAEVGPLRSHEDLERVEALVGEAVAGGAELVCGGRTTVSGLAGAFYAPAVLRRVPADARILAEPAPGPVLSVVEARDEADAIAQARRAGASPGDRRARGGVVSIWAADRPKGERVARTVGAEQAWVNEHGVVAPGPALRLARHVAARQVASRPALLSGARRLPYDPGLVRARTAAARFAHGRESDRFAVLRGNARPLAAAALRTARDAIRSRTS